MFQHLLDEPYLHYWLRTIILTSPRKRGFKTLKRFFEFSVTDVLGPMHGRSNSGKIFTSVKFIKSVPSVGFLNEHVHDEYQLGTELISKLERSIMPTSPTLSYRL
jgi:hypothetical protein